ncbi:MAG: cysteine--tRNA ligase [Planctomycetota bacterium]
MTFQVHNTLTNEKEAFEPAEKGVVRMYNCGPTVYGRPHIGNYRSFLFADVLRRWLEYKGYRVEQVMNVTDVGHLTNDDVADAGGDDKVEAQARREKKDPFEITRGYTDLFLEDMAALGVKEPMARPRATEYIDEMVEMVETLVEKGHAYRVGGNVYFDVTTFPDYGRLSGNRIEDLVAGARIEVNDEKRHPADFALWKSDEAHLMKWATVFGEHGFPGWHIECSAMAKALLGPSIDIHTGGEDNVFPHHECEIAQSACANDVPMARYWMHAKFLQVDGGKMSKSLGNVYQVPDVVERGFEPRHLRFALVRGHYRTQINFTWEIMDEVRARTENLDEICVMLHRILGGAGGAAEDADAGRGLLHAAREKFEAGLDDDLNMPVALAALEGLRKPLLEKEVGAAVASDMLEWVRRANGVLGFVETEEQSADAEVEALIQQRNDAKAAKDWPAADAARDALNALGIELQDTPEGTVWRRR